MADTSIFNPTITLDGIVGLIALAGGALAVFIRLGGIASKVEDHGKKLDKLTGIIEVQTRHDERLTEITRRVNLMDQRWEDMRHGEGYVLPLMRDKKPKAE